MIIFKSCKFLKYFYIVIAILLYKNIAIGQVFPQGLIHNNNAYPNKPLKYHDGSFTTTNFYREYNNGYVIPYIMYPNPYIQSDLSLHFKNSSPFTIQFTFSEDWISQSGSQMIFGFKDNLNNTKFYFQRDLATNKLYPNMNNTRLGNIIIQNGINYGRNKQQHITLTYDGIRWVGYLNGVKSSDEINSISFEFVGNLIFGIIGNANYSYSTTFDEVRFWDRALNQVEITANWNKSLVGDEDGLQVYYNFDSQSKSDLNKSSLIDVSPSKNNGIYKNLNPFCFFSNGLNYPIIDNLILNFDANDLESYPGTGSNVNQNPASPGKLYNLKNFYNNLQFYNSISFNQVASPIYYADGGRSIGIQGIYGKTNMNTGIEGDMSITIEAWVKLNTLNNITIVSIGENYDGNQFELAISNNKLLLNVGGNNQLSCSTSLIKNKWYHVVCTYDNWQYNMYINGLNERIGWYIGAPPYSRVPNENDILVPLNIVNTPLYIGTNQKLFDGKIGILKVYERALKASEITNKYNASKMRFGY
jgi:hypothetical protein